MRNSFVVLLALFWILGCDHHRNQQVFFVTSWPGDYDGDGLSEILVGAPFDNAGGTQRGRVYLYAGAVGGPSTLANVLYDGAEDNGQFGAAVVAIGDFNGDGFPDFAVGAPHQSGAAPGDQRGRVYIYFGGTSFPTSPSITLTGTENNGHFGASLGRAGDITGDGLDKLVVGAPDEAGTGALGSQRGRAYVFSFTGGTAPILTLNGTEDGGHFGFAVDTAGDMNGDGFFDVLVGAPMENSGGGRAYVFYGAPSPSTSPGLTLAGAAGSQFGTSVAGLLDVNVDSFDDIAVGAPLDPAVAAGAGRAFVFFGAPSPSTSPAITINGIAGSHLGALVTRIGDLNADGAPDLLVGAPLDDASGAPGSQRGRAFIFFGGPSVSNVPGVTLSGTVDMGHFGASGFSSGDANGDGLRDLVIGAPNDSTNGAASGRAFFFLGGFSMGTSPAQTLDGAPQAGAQFGTAVQ